MMITHLFRLNGQIYGIMFDKILESKTRIQINMVRLDTSSNI